MSSFIKAKILTENSRFYRFSNYKKGLQCLGYSELKIIK